jgi:hypothetical protein
MDVPYVNESGGSVKREKVAIEGVRRSAELIIIRLGLGGFALGGPRQNVLEVESLAAWSATVNELFGEGYEMVAPADYAAACKMTPEEVTGKIRDEGSLFALVYEGGETSDTAVPLEEKEVKEELGPHLV